MFGEGDDDIAGLDVRIKSEEQPLPRDIGGMAYCCSMDIGFCVCVAYCCMDIGGCVVKEWNDNDLVSFGSVSSLPPLMFFSKVYVSVKTDRCRLAGGGC
jgi:hypothetical protein